MDIKTAWIQSKQLQHARGKAQHTPSVNEWLRHGRMRHPATEGVTPCGDEGHIDQALELPLLVEGQVSVLDVGNGLVVLEQFDVNLGWVKASDEAVENILLSLLGA